MAGRSLAVHDLTIPSNTFSPPLLTIMNNFITQKLQRFLRDESGPTAVEYAVMVALIIIVCIASIGIVGQNTDQLFQTSGDTMQQVNATVNSGN